MADVTNELIYETLKQVEELVDRIDHKVDELRSELRATRDPLAGIQQDIGNIHQILLCHEAHLNRIERRLELNVVIAP